MTTLKLTPETIVFTAGGDEITVAEMIDRLYDEIENNPEDEFRLSIGTDSMTYRDTFFVVAIVLHRVGKGGTFFYKRMQHEAMKTLRDKLYTETEISVDATDMIVSELLERNENICNRIKLSIHLDIGENGPTKVLIPELEGWVMALGYEYAIKPNSYAASTIANIYSK